MRHRHDGWLPVRLLCERNSRNTITDELHSQVSVDISRGLYLRWLIERVGTLRAHWTI